MTRRKYYPYAPPEVYAIEKFIVPAIEATRMNRSRFTEEQIMEFAAC